MNQNILGDKKKISFDDNLADIVNKIFDGKPDVVPENEIILPDSEFPIVDLERLELDVCLYSEELSFDESLEKLRSRGYQRHLRPAEYSSIMFEALKNPEGKYKTIAMWFNNHNFWLSAAIYFSPETIKVVLDPENWCPPKLKGKRYVFQVTPKLRASLLKKNAHVPLEYFSEELVKLLYGRKIEDFPKEVLNRNPTISVNGLNTFFPISILAENGKELTVGKRCSFGVREK
ncbi:hypothetical protein HZA97_01170 [Candidatus Woesearchaeota archaeon]|nr:hypothetical protein [Candidatus Woesearchaeota archaeon]